MKKLIIRLFVLIVLTPGCETDLEDPLSVAEDQTLQLYAFKTTLPANGRDTTHIFCRIPEEAGRLDITFTITKGVFVQSNINTIKQATDSLAGNFRYAVVSIRSDTVKNTVYITAETGINRKRIPITFN